MNSISFPFCHCEYTMYNIFLEQMMWLLYIRYCCCRYYIFIYKIKEALPIKRKNSLFIISMSCFRYNYLLLFFYFEYIITSILYTILDCDTFRENSFQQLHTNIAIYVNIPVNKQTHTYDQIYMESFFCILCVCK